MADNTNNNTSERGLGSPNMKQSDKDRIHEMGGKASAKSKTGSAGSTEAAKKGGEHSHQND